MKQLEKNLWKQYRNEILTACFCMMLPFLLALLVWNQLPSVLPMHYNLSGQVDGYAAKWQALLLPGLIEILIFLMVVFFVLKDPRQQGQNQKAMKIMFWIFPALSLMTYLPIFAAVFGITFNMMKLICFCIAILFIVMGNILPKVKINSTYGVRLPWTLHSPENWKMTNRLFGKMAVISGFLLLAGIWLPETLYVWLFFIVLVLLCLIPTVYSYRMYRTEEKSASSQAAIRKSTWAAGGILAVIVILVCVVLFTGSVSSNIDASTDTLNLSASFWTDTNIELDDIAEISLSDDFDPGSRENGVGSFAVLAGTFQNEQWGTYTLYAAYNAKEYILITTKDDQHYAIALSEEDKTQALYQQLKETIQKAEAS